MPIIIQNSKAKLMCEGSKIAKMYCEGDVIYSSGNICTYIVDGETYATIEMDEGENVLNKVAAPSKSLYTFSGWSLTNGGSIVSNLIMGDNPITLYAVWQYVGAPFYIVKNLRPQQTVITSWTATKWNNGTGVEWDNFKAGDTGIPGVYTKGVESPEEGNSFEARSNAFSTKGNRTIRINCVVPGKGGKITINGVTKELPKSATVTFDISNTSSISITVSASIYGYSGSAYFQFYEIYLY